MLGFTRALFLSSPHLPISLHQNYLFSSISGKWDLPLLSVPFAQYNPPPFSFPPKNGTNTKNIAQITKIMPIPCISLALFSTQTHLFFVKNTCFSIINDVFLLKNPFSPKNICIFLHKYLHFPQKYITFAAEFVSFCSRRSPVGRPKVTRRSTEN